jgi:uncharacterized protein involved in tolerance to divalent cations
MWSKIQLRSLFKILGDNMMKSSIFTMALIFVFMIEGIALSNTELEQEEILQIFETLVSNSRNTLIPHGTIEAEHQEFSLYNDYSVDSSVIVKFDGDRFYWEVNTNSTDKQIQQNLNDNDRFSENYGVPIWSKKRVLAWDGEQYTMYFGPGKHAIVTEDVSNIPVQVDGPLTAGVIPWGEGIYAYESLSSADLSAVELDIDGQKKIYIDISMPRIPEMYLTLDSEKENAVLSHSYVTDEGYSISFTCSGHELVSGIWIPKEILVERYNYNKDPVELFSRDYWIINSVDVNTPPLLAFDVSYDKGTLVEYYLELSETPFSCHHSNEVDTDSLLQESILNKFRENSHTNNCATAAVKYAALKFGNEIADSNLAQLINTSDKTTSLYSMKEFLQQNGLHCLAVKTDIQTLKNLIQNYQVILHFPDINHYVVLQDIENKYAWLIDPNRKRFLYRKKIKEFSIDWNDGTALLISKEPIDVQGQVPSISDEELHSIIGSDGVGNYSCSKLIQQGDVVFCMKVGWLCGGRYSYYLIRYGCEPDENGGDCFGEPMISKVSWPCINKLSDPIQCDTLGDAVFFYIRACQ